MRIIFGFVLSLLGATSALASTTCVVDLVGAERLRREDPDGYAAALAFLAPTLAAPRVRGHFVDVFGPDEIAAALKGSGASPEAIAVVLKRMDQIGRRVYETRPAEVPITYNALEFLINVHDVTASPMHLCVLEAGCPEFNLRNLHRPALSIGLLGSVHVAPLNSTRPPPTARPSEFNFNVVFLRAGGDPELFVADMFTNLGAAAMLQLARTWVTAHRRANFAGEDARLFRRFGRVVDGVPHLDAHFLEFMKVMAGHQALGEYQRLAPLGAVSPGALKHRGRPATVEAALQAMSEPTRVAMAREGVTAVNAVATFRDWFSRMGTEVNQVLDLVGRGPR